MSAKSINFRKSQANALALQFWPRFFAFMIDYVLITYLVTPFIMIGLSRIISIPEVETSAFYSMETLKGPYGINIALLWIYFAAFESSKYRGTVGKIFLRYQITDKKGNRIALSTALLRFPLKLIAISTLIGVWIIDLTKHRQGFHDLICMTYVRKR